MLGSNAVAKLVDHERRIKQLENDLAVAQDLAYKWMIAYDKGALEDLPTRVNKPQ